jgi:hypothetical protein
MSFALTDSQEVILSVSAEDAANNPATLEGSLSWAVDDPTILNLTINDDGTVTVASTGKEGSATVTVSDADADSEGDSFTGSLAIDVVGGEVTQVIITPGAPTEIGS